MRILRGDRIGIIGKNGSGKTSFLKMLVGEAKPDSGKVKVAKDLEFSYFDQKRKDLIPDHSLQRILCPNGSDYIDVMGKARHVCGYLKDFLFDPKMAQHPVSVLSGGQKNRLMLAKIMANPGGMLILDEPTNDLDMDTLDMLEDMLAKYAGTLLVVSHDRDFLDQTVTKILAFEGDGKIDAVIGGYQDYLAKRKFKDTPQESVKPKARKQEQVAPKSGGKMTYIQEYELKNLPAKITALEKEIAFTENQLADHDLYTRDAVLFDRLTRGLAQAQTALQKAEDRWLELDELRGE
ncbi:MAG: ATP-binding cassette domain-containing protein [Alphaproteobacteria bacterium]|nr:ATP-binding cassette domain-containing protein [Alphaproteobacteria bacterium]